MALSADRKTRTKAGGAARRGVRGVAADAVIYMGALIAKNAAGFLVAASDIAAITIVGVSEQNVDNDGGSNGDLTCAYVTAIEAEFDNAGGAILVASLGKSCYVADDKSVTTAAVAANDVLVGIVQEFSTTKVWVFIDEATALSTANADPLDGSDADTVANANTEGGIPVVHVFEIADAATADYDITLVEKTEFYDFVFIKTGAAGVAVTVQMKNTATAITDAVDLADADKVISRPLTIDDASNVVAAGGKLRASIVRTTSGGGVKIIALGFKRA